MIFDRWKKRNGFKKYAIHFHGLRHTFSNMLFELNENPKVIQQLLGHRDVKATITVYNNVNSDYIKEITNRLNDKLNENEALRKQNNQNNQNKEKQEKKKSNLKNFSDEDFDLILEEMLKERKERNCKREKDLEM